MDDTEETIAKQCYKIACFGTVFTENNATK